MSDDPMMFDPERPPNKATERDMLDLLNKRYGRTYTNGAARIMRWTRAEHVRREAGAFTSRTADYIAMDVWPGIPYGTKLALHGHEIKVSRSDWLTELKDPSKANAFVPHMDYWWVVVSDPAIVREGELPDGWGLLYRTGEMLRVKVPAARLVALPVPKDLLAGLLRATAKTCARLGSA